MITFSMILGLALFFVCSGQPLWSSLTELPPSPAPQPTELLPKMLDITWSAGPHLPLGVQDNRVGIINNWMISTCGFCSGVDGSWKKDKYLRGFYNDTYMLDLNHPEKGWSRERNFWGAPRQGMQAVVVNDAFYVWGGFSYHEPWTYKDGYKYEQSEDGVWRWIHWKPLPELPWPITWGGTCAIGGKIYIIGGCDFDYKKFTSETNRDGSIKDMGKRLLVLDTAKEDAGWKELTPCPGTDRLFPAVGVVDNKIYVIGGASARSKDGKMYSTVDSWRYDPTTDAWQRLRDLPLSVGDFGQGTLVYKNRYILLPCGAPREVLRLNGNIEPIYGTVSKVERTWKNHPKLEGMSYYNHCHVYDTLTNLYGTMTKLPYDDSTPGIYVLGDAVYLFACETAGFRWEGEYFGQQPEFVLKGLIKELDWPEKSSETYELGNNRNN